MNWFFDGIGTEIISLIFGLIFGGCVGYRIGISQKSGKKSKQIQAGKSVIAGRDIITCESVEVNNHDKNN